MNFKPMLAASLDGIPFSKLRYPLLVSPKLDGVRCIVWEGVAYSRNAKPIRNHFVQKWATNFHNMDGELIVGDPTDAYCLNTTQSGVMSFDGEPDFSFHLFDCIQAAHRDFESRLMQVQDEMCREERVTLVPHREVTNPHELEAYERQWLEMGYEGMMLRSPDGPYKHGRSTLREGWLMKLKRFQDGEALVVALEEGSSNQNVLTRDELGRAKRTRHQDGMCPSGMVGTIIAVDPVWGELRIAPGVMAHAERISQWESRDLIGKKIHWRSFGYGVKDKPRFPRYYGIREDV